MTSSSPKIELASSNKKAKAVKKTGSTIETIHGQRKVKVYPVYESELSQLSYFNTVSTALFSVGSFFASDAARNGIDNMLDNKSVYISAALYFVGVIIIICRWRAISNIKSSAVHR